jgi:hypothetical protein
MTALELEGRARGERFMIAPPRVARQCPRCGRETTRHGFFTRDGLWLETHHCPAHGPVCPKGPKLESSP